MWARLKDLEGEEFETKTGKPFTFEISGGVFKPTHVAQNIAKGNFEKALALWPLDGPGEISAVVRGSAYVWAVLHDPRVRKGEW